MLKKILKTLLVTIAALTLLLLTVAFLYHSTSIPGSVKSTAINSDIVVYTHVNSGSGSYNWIYSLPKEAYEKLKSCADFDCREQLCFTKKNTPNSSCLYGDKAFKIEYLDMLDVPECLKVKFNQSKNTITTHENWLCTKLKYQNPPRGKIVYEITDTGKFECVKGCTK